MDFSVVAVTVTQKPDPRVTLIPSSIKVLDVNGNPVTDVTVSLN